MNIVLFGGRSDERHVSVATAQNVARTLENPLLWFWAPNGAVHDVSRDELLTHERPFVHDFEPSRPAIWPDLEMALDTIPVEEPLFVLALHGGEGEDGTVQRLLEARGIPFTGSGAAASALAFDKGRGKDAVRGHVRVAESRIARTPAEIESAVTELLGRHPKIVLKPLAGGSSRGLFFLDREGDQIDVGRIVAKAVALRVPYIVEQFITGRELTVGVADFGDGPKPLPVIEVEVDPGFTFDYDGKYLGKGTREICPANIPDAMARAAQETAVAAHEALGCEGYSRSDLIAAEDGTIYFLEVNTLPGLTGTSLVPKMLATSGIEMRTFLEKQIELAQASVLSRARERVAQRAG
jgi:D-alanine-D-alanine ligase